MMRYFLISLLMISGIAAAQLKTGFTEIEKIENDKSYSWFTTTYAGYEPDRVVIDSMMTLPSDFKLLVFAGVWCDDSQNLLPKLYKCSDQVNISRSDISLYLLDESKMSGDGLEKKYQVTNVPTFIVLKDGKEVGRITEHVHKSMEKDLLEILR